jgi:predicted O-methyltransferase YrrM
MEEKPLSILIATPTMGDVPMQYAHSIVAMILKTKDKYPECKIAMATTYRKMHHRARTELAEAFLQTDCTHILWVDDDNIPREKDLIKLIEDDLPIVSGLYFRRAEPYEPIIMVKRENGRGTERRPDLYRSKEGKPFKIHSTGMGFMLIRREVIEKVKSLGMPLFDIRGGFGEDIWFCNQCHGAGYDVWLDPRVEVAHLGEKVMVTGKTYDEFYNRKVIDLVKKAEEVEGWCKKRELEYLAEAASQSNFTIEVGSHAGRSTIVLSNSRRLVCVDHFTEQDIFDKFAKNTAGLKNVQFIKKKSVEAAEDFPDNCADVIFIDGSHEYEDVKADIKAYWEKLGIGGRFIFHDYIPEFPGVIKAIDEFVKEIGAFASFSKIPNTSMVEIIKL